MLNFNHLYYFYMTVKLGGVMKAALALRISQPALSAQLKTLSEKIDCPLFKKSGRKLILTPEGERTYSYCRRIFGYVAEFSDYLKNTGPDKTQRTQLGVADEIERPFVVDILMDMLKKQNGDHSFLAMNSESHSVLLDRLRSSELDALITNYITYGEDIQVLAEIQMPVIAVTTPAFAKAHGLTKKTSFLTALRAKEAGLLLPSSMLKLRMETDFYLQRGSIRGKIVFESDNVGAILRATVEGLGVALLPKPYVSRELKAGIIRIIGEEKGLWNHTISLITLKHNETPPVLKDLLFHFNNLAQISDCQALQVLES